VRVKAGQATRHCLSEILTVFLGQVIQWKRRVEQVRTPSMGGLFCWRGQGRRTDVGNW
jgi:hypothetical protein